MAEENILSQSIDYMKPKAHDAIDKATNAWKQAQQQAESSGLGDFEHEELIQNLVMGTMGGGGGIPLKQMLKNLGLYRGQMSGKHWKNVESIKKGVEDIVKRNQDTVKKLKKMGAEQAGLKEYHKSFPQTLSPTKKPSFDIGGWKNVPIAQVKKVEPGGTGKWGLAGLLGLLGLADRFSDTSGESYDMDAARNAMIDKGSEFYDENIYSILEGLISDPDMSGAGDMPIGQTDFQPRHDDPNYYEGETKVSANDKLLELLKRQIDTTDMPIRQPEWDSIINKPKHYSVPGF